MTLPQDRLHDVRRDQLSSAGSLIDPHRSFSRTRPSLDEDPLRREITICEVTDGTGENCFSVETEKALRSALLAIVGPVLRPRTLTFRTVEMM
jgi:hypothetical protein